MTQKMSLMREKQVKLEKKILKTFLNALGRHLELERFGILAHKKSRPSLFKHILICESYVYDRTVRSFFRNCVLCPGENKTASLTFLRIIPISDYVPTVVCIVHNFHNLLKMSIIESFYSIK